MITPKILIFWQADSRVYMEKQDKNTQGNKRAICRGQGINRGGGKMSYQMWKCNTEYSSTNRLMEQNGKSRNTVNII